MDIKNLSVGIFYTVLNHKGREFICKFAGIEKQFGMDYYNWDFGDVVVGEPLGADTSPTPLNELAVITWNCCTDGVEPDWSVYASFELSGCKEREGEAGCTEVERIDSCSDERPVFYTLYANLKGGGCEAINDFFPLSDLQHITAQCERLARRLNFQLMFF